MKEKKQDSKKNSECLKNSVKPGNYQQQNCWIEKNCQAKILDTSKSEGKN